MWKTTLILAREHGKYKVHRDIPVARYHQLIIFIDG
jgi:hypothetical protein